MEKLSFDFGDGWDFDTISVTFHPQRGKPIKVPILPGTEIDIPAEVMEHSGETRFVVSGRVIGEDGTIERQAITLEGYVDVAYTADEKGGNTRKVTADMYDRLLDQASKIFDEAREDVSRLATEAAESASDAEGFADSAEEDANSAEKSASAAETAEQAASKSAGEAKTAADTAAGAASNAAQSADDATSAASAAKASATAAETARASAEQIAEGIPKTVQDALQEAKDSGEFDGENGIAPHIGPNGNWYIGDTDTGVKAEGKQGAEGKPGVHVGSDAPPAGTRVWVNPDGERTKIPKVDDTLTKPGYAADAAKVGEKFDQLSGEIADNTPTLNYVETKTVYLGDNVIGAATLGAGWTESGGVFTHATGNDADLTFETAVEDGAVYILEFDTSYTANEFVRVGIGDRYRVLCYQGKSHITVPLMASGGTTLYITPISTTYTGSISNVTLRKIQDSGTELGLEIYSTATDNHTQNYGFWNTFIGENTAENAVGSTRSVVIGYYTLNALQGGHRNIGIGTFAMSQMIGGEDNIAIGSDNMLEVKGAEACVSIGFAAMYKGKKRTEDIAIGISAMRGDATSDTGGNIAIGKQAGYKVTTAKSNIFLGKQAGYNLTSGYSNTLIGDGAAKSLTTGYFNTVIGRNAVVPAAARGAIVIGDGATATKNYQAVIGADNITETLIKGDLVVRGTDGVMRQIVFNADGTCSWTAVT
jgi:hypothetical protein